MPEEQRPSQRETPKAISIIVCDTVIEDKRTSNKTLVGLFNTVVASEFPCTQHKLCVVVSLTNGHGEWPLCFRIEGPDQEELLSIEGRQIFGNPLEVVDIVLELTRVTFPRPGTYTISLRADWNLLGERRISVERFQGEEENEGGN